jgi:hypothetical protein
MGGRNGAPKEAAYMASVTAMQKRKIQKKVETEDDA